MQPSSPTTPEAGGPSSARAKASARKTPASHNGVALGVFLAGVALSGAGFAWSLSHEADLIREDMSQRAASLAVSIRREVVQRTRLLDALAAFLEVARGESRPDLRNFLTDLTRSQNSVVLDWIPRVLEDDRKGYEEKQWLQGSPDFRVHRGSDPLPPAPEYLPLAFGVGAGATVAGLDLGPGSDLSAVATLAPALATARAERAPVAAATVQVARPEGTRPGVLFFSPVFAAKAAPGSDVDRPFLGYAFGLFDIDSIARDAIGEVDRSTFSFDLKDTTAGAAAVPLFLQHAPHGEDEDFLLRLWTLVGGAGPDSVLAFDVGGRRWSLSVGAGSGLVASHVSWIPWIVAIVGLLLSIGMSSVASGYAARGTVLATARRRLALERRDFMEKASRLSEDLEREKLDRRRTEESLFREKQQFRLMFNAVPAMIFYKDTKNRFLLVNEAAAAAMGRTVEEMEGKPCSEIVPAKAYELYRDDLEIIQTGKPKLALVEETVGSNGKSAWTRTDKLPEYDAMGRVVGILVFSQDITDHRQAEAEVRRLNEELEQRVSVRTAELRAANQELESFAYSVSHDLRTPLRTIDGFSKLVLEEHGDALPPSAHDYLQRLCGAAQRMGHLIDDLLKLTRVSRAELRREEVDLGVIARQAVEDLKRANPERRVDVVIEATPFAVGDPVLLSNVMQNLIGNAWKFTSKTAEPRIEFGSRTVSGDRTAFYVRDNGVGFDMVYADKLFGAFQRLHSHEQFEGSGIGLATVQLIIRRHAGEVWAESVPDQGTTFYFTLGS